MDEIDHKMSPKYLLLLGQWYTVDKVIYKLNTSTKINVKLTAIGHMS